MTTIASQEVHVLVNIPSDDRTGPGKITAQTKDGFTWMLRCTVKACDYAKTSHFYSEAQRAAFQHAQRHIFA